MYFDKEIFIDEDDQCFTCEHFNKGVNCPLLEALGEGIVFMDPTDDVLVKNCGFYKEFKRHLSVVKTEKQA